MTLQSFVPTKDCIKSGKLHFIPYTIGLLAHYTTELTPTKGGEFKHLLCFCYTNKTAYPHLNGIEGILWA